MGMDMTTAHEDVARVGLIKTCENPDERGFAGAVLTDEGVDFARHDCQVNTVQRKRA